MGTTGGKRCTAAGEPVAVHRRSGAETRMARTTARGCRSDVQDTDGCQQDETTAEANVGRPRRHETVLPHEFVHRPEPARGTQF